MQEVTEEFEIRWREVESDPPDRGVFIELARAECADLDRFGLNDSKKIPLERTYWARQSMRMNGLYWRPVPADSVFLAPPSADRLPITEDDWYVVLLVPQQELTTVPRLHEMREELYVPITRRRIKTGRVGKNGHKKTRVIPKPMFPGYGFVRVSGIRNVDDMKDIRGVRDVLRDEGRKAIVLPHEAILAIFRRQSQAHQDFVLEAASRRNRPRFKSGASVRLEAPGNVYDGMLANIERDDGKGNIVVLLGMIRTVLPADMVVAA